MRYPFVAVTLAASLIGCRRSPTSKDAGTVDAVASSTPLPRGSSTPILDASVDAYVPTAVADGTIGLLVEHVILATGQDQPTPYRFDLLVLTTPPGRKATRSQPFCPPLKRDMYEMCRRFRACSVSDAGAVVVCDGVSFELVQHDGATYLQGEAKVIEVSRDTRALAPPTTRERRAYIDL